MHRRTFLAATATGLAGTAGCLGGTASAPEDRTTRTPAGTPVEMEGPMHDDDLPADDDPTDGYPPAFDRVPEERPIDTDSYETTDEGVVLAPIEDAYYWYARREARFVDARSSHAFEKSHVFGAVSSPVGNLNDGGFEDPVDAFPKEDRIVAYCGCPHHLSSMRAKAMMDEGYGNVFVIDEGFWEWHDRSYPLAGADAGREPAALVLRGRTDPASAGETAWARHRPTGQMEATDVRADGTYEMTLRFFGLSARSRVEVETPDYVVEAPLSVLAGDVITGSE